MSRLLRAFALSLPLMAAGSLAAHQAAYRLAAGDGAGLARSGHGYLERAGGIVAIMIALGLVGFGLAVSDGLAVRAGRPLRLWPFALLPPLGFAIQEHLERLLESGSFPWHAALERTFALGLLLQLPFALLAYLAARSLRTGGLRLGGAIGVGVRRSPPRLRAGVAPSRVPSAWAPPRHDALAVGYGERGPPAAGPR